MLESGKVATRLPAQNLERAKAFYAEKLGLEPVEEREGGLRYVCAAGEFALFESTGTASGEHTHRGRHGRASALVGRLAPLAAHERAMPPQQRPRAEQTRGARGAWQVAGRRREQGTICGAKPRTRDLAAQNLKRMAQNQQLEVL
jgi:catechol 2,3-dioxygenase-like lactoylglutathione lyase family enzyme